MNAYTLARDGQRIVCIEMSELEAVELQRTVTAWQMPNAPKESSSMKDRVYDALTSLFFPS